MVRLQSAICFNSKMVRFKAQNGKTLTLAVSVSIPKWYDLKASSTCLKQSVGRCFNSKMVRFKVREKDSTGTALLGFNSKMVRFKALAALTVPLKLLCFNSKMVRFKVASPQGNIRTFYCFNSKMVRFKDVGSICYASTGV